MDTCRDIPSRTVIGQNNRVVNHRRGPLTVPTIEVLHKLCDVVYVNENGFCGRRRRQQSRTDTDKGTAELVTVGKTHLMRETARGGGRHQQLDFSQRIIIHQTTLHRLQAELTIHSTSRISRPVTLRLTVGGLRVCASLICTRLRRSR